MQRRTVVRAHDAPSAACNAAQTEQRGAHRPREQELENDEAHRARVHEARASEHKVRERALVGVADGEALVVELVIPVATQCVQLCWTLCHCQLRVRVWRGKAPRKVCDGWAAWEACGASATGSSAHCWTCIAATPPDGCCDWHNKGHTSWVARAGCALRCNDCRQRAASPPLHGCVGTHVTICDGLARA
jgi:hypothetical protein